MTDVVVHCGECGCNFKFAVDVDPATSTLDDLKQRVVEKLGGGEYICPRCNSVVFVHFGDAALSEPERLRRAELAQRIGRRDRGIRFGVGSPDGPRSAVWRLWLNNRGDDVYLAARSLARDVKVSLHPNFWYYGFTEHYAGRATSLLPPGVDRKRDVWERPPEFAPGWTRAFVIVIPSSEVLDAPGAYEGSEAVWLPKAPESEATHFTVLLSKPGAARGRRGFPSAEGYENVTELITCLDMSTGETLWLVAHNQPMTDEDVAAIEKARSHMAEFAGASILAEARRNETFQPRAILYGDQTDGARHFFDVSLDALIVHKG